MSDLLVLQIIVGGAALLFIGFNAWTRDIADVHTWWDKVLAAVISLLIAAAIVAPVTGKLFAFGVFSVVFGLCAFLGAIDAIREFRQPQDVFIKWDRTDETLKMIATVVMGIIGGGWSIMVGMFFILWEPPP